MNLSTVSIYLCGHSNFCAGLETSKNPSSSGLSASQGDQLSNGDFRLDLITGGPEHSS